MIDDVEDRGILISAGRIHNHIRLWVRQPGRGWSGRRTPCYFDAAAAFVTTRQFAAVCGEVPGAGEQMTSGWVSSDAGRSWQRVGNPGVAGYVGDLDVRYPDTWILARGRGTIEVSQDGGHHWHSGLKTDPNVRATAGAGWSWTGFTTPDEAAALPESADSPYLAVTRDAGTHWELRRLRLR